MQLLSKVISHFRRARPIQHRRRIAFIHLPKCAGTSLDKAIACNYSPTQVRRLAAKESKCASDWLGRDYAEYCRDLFTYELMCAGNVSYLAGHWITDQALCQRFMNDWDFVTVLREPVERWFSHYFYNRFKTSDHFRITDDLEPFLASERAGRLGSTYVRHLACVRDDANAGFDLHIEHACRTLDLFASIGLVSDLKSFGGRLGATAGISVRLRRANTNPAQREMEVASQDPIVRRKVELLCKPDLAVFAHAKQLIASGRNVRISK